MLLVSAVTMHNIPEGMAIGVAFGGSALGVPGSTAVGAAILALGIGLQNFPEGAAVSLPLRREGYSRGKSFFLGQASGRPAWSSCRHVATGYYAVVPFLCRWGNDGCSSWGFNTGIGQHQQKPGSNWGGAGVYGNDDFRCGLGLASPITPGLGLLAPSAGFLFLLKVAAAFRPVLAGLRRPYLFPISFCEERNGEKK